MHHTFLLEGPDSAGKTTLARAIKAQAIARGEKFCYIHLTLRKEMALWQLAALTRARQKAKTHVVVIDRHWMSEQVYGAVYRDQVVTDYFALAILCATVAMGAINVMCVPTVSTAKFFFGQTEAREMYANDHKVFRVAQAYRDLTFGAEYPELVFGTLGYNIAKRIDGLMGLAKANLIDVKTYEREPYHTLSVAEVLAYELLNLPIQPRSAKALRDTLFGRSSF